MNYQMLKILLDSLVLNFTCPSCNNKVFDNSLEIVGAAWNSINLDIFCPTCEKHTFVKAEVSQINLWNLVNLNKENLQDFKQKLLEKLSGINLKKTNFWETRKIEAKINEKEILELREIFKNENINVWDIFGGN